MIRVAVCCALVACSTPEPTPAGAPEPATPSAALVSISASAPIAPAPLESAPLASAPPPNAALRPAAAGAALLPAAAAPPSGRRGASAGGHFCFSWRTGHESSNPCYASLASCNAERRALAQTQELTRCSERKDAYCTRIAPGGDLAEGRHCFGDAARCMAFRAETVGHASASPCTPQ